MRNVPSNTADEAAIFLPNRPTHRESLTKEKPFASPPNIDLSSRPIAGPFRVTGGNTSRVGSG
ncbi:MAG: hypothetical protein AAGJ31_10715, partial [Verrucomicrobiota bacterium]